MTRLYIELGITERALDIAVSLDIKNIQFDTLSFLFTDGIESLGQFSYPSRILQNSLSIYDRNEIEVIWI
jgi:N-terminal acetyltransferase B complex non-catalytic subunit